MADEEEVASTFPNPPKVFYSAYTDDNVKAGQAPAPPPPAKGIYFMFGAKCNTEDPMLRTLQDQNIKQLYNEVHDRKEELKKLNRSIIVCFLELLDILISNPASPARNQKISDLSLLFINMHHLINDFRPHQARETLKVIMERQKKKREDIVAQIQRDFDKAQAILGECGEYLAQTITTIPHSMKIAQTGGGVVSGSGSDTTKDTKTELMDFTTEDMSSKVSRKDEALKLVEAQDYELCNLIDSLISNT